MTRIAAGSISGRISANLGTSDASTMTTESSAWVATYPISAVASRMFSVCSTAPIEGTAR